MQDRLATEQVLPALKPRALRGRLLALAISGLLPFAIAAIAALYYVVQDRIASAEGAALVTARSIAASVEAEVNATMAVLGALALSAPLQESQIDRFEQQARSVVELRGWRAVTLTDATGQLIFTTASAGVRGGKVVDQGSVELALQQRKPVVGTLLEGPRTMGPAFAVRIPVERDGQVRHVLSAVIGASQVLAIVKRQQLPPSHIVAIFDAAGTRVARSLENANKDGSPSLQALIQRGGSEGSGLTRTLEDRPVHTAYTRLDGLGWIVVVGISAAESQSTLATSLGAAALGLLASLGLSIWMTWYFARKVTEPIEQLKRAAAELGRGAHVSVPRLEIKELQDVAAALAAASSERQHAADERERLLAQTTDALSRAEEAVRAKDEFLAVLGHELRNPLAPISSALRLMAMKSDEATRVERQIVERQLSYMTRLVDDLLDVSRVTRGNFVLHEKPVCVGHWIEEGLEPVRNSLGGRQLKVLIPEAAELSWVQGDSVRLVQVLTNLVGNAIKFTSDTGRICVSAQRMDDWVEIEITDDGAGMTPEALSRVFEEFYQAPQTHHRSVAGLGLGLSIVRNLVGMHGGTVTGASEGRSLGSRFTVRLPCIAAPSQPAALPVGEKNAEPIQGSVLVVDDNQDAANTASALLEACGFTVRVAYGPYEALTLLDDFPAQVAVLDIGLPDMDGYKLAGAIRSRPDGQRIRLIALTGYGQDSDKKRAYDAGFNMHITKPVTPDELIDVVARLAQEQQAPGSQVTLLIRPCEV